MDLGVCISEQVLDDGKGLDGPCFASVGGGPAVRVENIARLPKDILWVTNLRAEDLSKVASWRAFLRGSDYLGINLKHICSDLEIGTNSKDQIEHISVLSNIISGLYKKYLAPLDLNLRGYPYNIYLAIKEKHFGELVEQVTNYDAKLVEWINGCVQTTTECRQGTYSFGPRVCIRDNSYKHVCGVFGSPTPSGRHGFFSPNKFGGNREATIDKILQLDMFSICKISKIKAKTGYPGLFGFGQMFANKTSSSEQRSHVSNFELAFMSELFDFEVDEVLLFEGYREDPGVIQSLVHGTDPLNSLGYAAMLYHINLIRARVDKWKVGTGSSGSAIESRSSICSMVYGARDRMLTYSMAQALANFNLSVHSYRNGYVFIDSDERKIPELKKLAMKNAWMYPA